MTNMSLLKASNRRRIRVRDSSSTSSPNFSPVNKKLNFNIFGDEDTGEEAAASGRCGSGRRRQSSTAANAVVEEPPQFQMDLETEEEEGGAGDVLQCMEEALMSENFSPCRTRSGCVYESGLKKRKFRLPKNGGKGGLTSSGTGKSTGGGRSRISSGQSGTGSVADCSENGSEPSDDLGMNRFCDRLEMSCDEAPRSPPPLNYQKNPVSRFTLVREKKHRYDIPSSPISSHINNDHHQLSSPIMKSWVPEPGSPTLSFSPPTNNMRAMRLFDGLSSPNTACALTSPRSTPRGHHLKSRLLFGEGGEHRRASLPNNSQTLDCDISSCEKRLSANVNPFTPAAMLLASKKRSRSKRSINSSVGSSREELQASLDSLEGGSPDHDDDNEYGAAKRVRVSDISITRYETEFLELAEIATGEFGTVRQARHRLDGIVYAIKISKKKLRVNSHDEKKAMNEVFAHAAIMKHKHVVRYYNSWVEKGQVFIQNEFCEGGSLQARIQQFRAKLTRFSEQELKKIIVHVSKGLAYIHSKQLAHLDIKPDNIFIALEVATPTPPKRKSDHSTDSGAASGGHSPRQPAPTAAGAEEASPGDGEKVHYKIGDLGHVASVFGGEVSPEEGDCRYMAPEFLEMEVDTGRLTKADIFSLGLTIYEAASLRSLPRNSLDDPSYEKIKAGELPYLEHYSWEFNALLKSMVNPDPNARPSASKLLVNPTLNPSINKSRSQLYKELKAARERVARLEMQLSGSDIKDTSSGGGGDCFAANKENNAPQQSVGRHHYPTKKRLIGRGATKSSSCVL